MVCKIAKIGNSETINLAAAELKKYLSKIDNGNEYTIMYFKAYTPECSNALWVGISDNFKVPDVECAELDDAISVKVENLTGYITGSNERSVLIAVYRFLKELGCAFIRPGSDGEIIPVKSITDCKAEVFEAASYRHRAVCIEGSVSYDDVHDMVEWLPKAAMNGFYNQFRIPYEFYDRWYSHKKNEKNFEVIPFTPEDAEGLMNETVSDLKKRGLLYHAVGHGWTCEPFGIKGLGWYKFDKQLSEETKECFAMVNGERGLWGGVPMNTNLCYSSEKVREIMSDAIAEYSEKHPEIDYMHVWLADGTNNHCECDNCKKMLPSDYYVQLLNRIDEKLTKANLNTKIVFLIYVDLLWEPIKEKLKNPDRFVLMFAPITRSYSASMAESTEYDGTLVPYNRNHNKMPSSVAENIARLKNWQKGFKGDSFDFDYHYMWDHFKDLGNFGVASVLFEDMKNLDKIGLNGMVSCQCIRAFFPHGLGMNGMAAALWDKTADFNKVTDDYFNAAFGEDSNLVRLYMKELTKLSDPVFMRLEYDNTVDKSRVAQFEEALILVENFKSVIERNKNHENETVALSFEYLEYHNQLAKLYLELEIKLACGDVKGAEDALSKLTEFTNSTEKATHRVFDTYIFNRTIGRITEKINAAQ